MEAIKELEKVESGIEGFDKLTYGGFPSGRSYLIAGEPGTGKTIFSLQYLIAGIKKGEKAIYISIDEKPEHIIADAKGLGWDLSEYLSSGLLQIIDATHYFSAIYDQSGEKINVHQIVDDIIGHVKSSGAKRMAIDPIAPLIFSEKK